MKSSLGTQSTNNHAGTHRNLGSNHISLAPQPGPYKTHHMILRSDVEASPLKLTVHAARFYNKAEPQKPTAENKPVKTSKSTVDRFMDSAADCKPFNTSRDRDETSILPRSP